MCNLLAEAEEGVVEGVAASYSLLTQREPQHQVILHVVHVSVGPVKVYEPLEPTKGPPRKSVKKSTDTNLRQKKP